jgi:thiamine biosynthesis lipoprotein ApbE
MNQALRTPTDVLAALDEQVVCYQRLAKLAEQQHEHVQLSRTEDLLAVLEKRQEVLDQIGTLEATVGPIKRQWTAFVAGLDSPSRVRAEAQLAETRRLLEEITTADRNDALVLQQRKLGIGKQLNQASAAKVVNRNIAVAAYGSRGPRMDVRS